MDDNLLQMFVEDTRADLADIEADLLDFEEGGATYDPELVHRLFRAAHAIKGSASLLGLEKIRELAHRTENVLGMVRNGDMEISRDVVRSVVLSFDALSDMAESIETADAVETKALVEALISLISDALPPERHAAIKEKRRVVLPDGRTAFEVPAHDIIQARKSGNFLYLVEYDLIGDVHRRGKTPLDLLDFLEKSGLLLDCTMDIAAVGTLDDELTRRIPLYVFYATILEEDLVRAVFQVDSRYIHTVTFDEASGEECAVPLVRREPQRPAAAPIIDKSALDDMEAAFDQSLARQGSAAYAEAESAESEEETTVTEDISTADADVVLSGRLTIERAAEFKETLLRALDEGRDFSVDVSRVEDADVTFFQVLWAAYKSAEQRGVCISMAGDIPESLKEAAFRSGLADLTTKSQAQPDFPLMGKAVEC